MKMTTTTTPRAASSSSSPSSSPRSADFAPDDERRLRAMMAPPPRSTGSSHDPRSLTRRGGAASAGGYYGDDPSHAANGFANWQTRSDDGRPSSSSSSKPSPEPAAGTAVAADADAVPIPLAILAWYLLGIISITTSKILLSTGAHYHYDVSPLVLTSQQLLVGTALLRTLIELSSGTTGGEEGEVPPESCGDGLSHPKRKSSNDVVVDSRPSDRSPVGGVPSSSIFAPFDPSSEGDRQLLLSSMYFAAGFLLTNVGFKGGSAAFVETVKAAEPFTSASVAALWGIETLGGREVASLCGIVAGVVLSTMGHRGGAGGGDGSNGEGGGASASSGMATECAIVMLANLCFSFRGLHQKLFRRTPGGRASDVDDLELQHRMQRTGFLVLVGPTIVLEAMPASTALLKMAIGGGGGGPTLGRALRYVLLAIANGLAFASYNLASTYVLTRISVVHHAALNCIRRVFAIVITSLIFGSRITFLQMLGMALAVAGFFCYVRFKMRREARNRRREDLRKKWGGIVSDARRGGKKWGGKTSSILPT